MNAKRRGFLKWLPFLAVAAVVPVETVKAEPKKDPDVPLASASYSCSSCGSQLWWDVGDWSSWKQGMPIPSRTLYCRVNGCRLHNVKFEDNWKAAPRKIV